MKKLLMESNGEHRSTQIVKATLVLLTVVALSAMFWVGSTPVAKAQSPAELTSMLQAEMPAGKSLQGANKADFLAALSAAVQKHRSSAPALASFAASLHPEWKKDILRTIFHSLGDKDCRLLARVLQALTAGDPNASELTDLAIQLAPSCASSFGGGGGGGTQPPGSEDEGNFGPVPMNQNPPPGSIGGGGGQGNLIAVCFNGVTQFLTPEAASEFLRTHPGATLGECQVTQSTNN